MIPDEIWAALEAYRQERSSARWTTLSQLWIGELQVLDAVQRIDPAFPDPLPLAVDGLIEDSQDLFQWELLPEADLVARALTALEMDAQMTGKPGFIAALDQSGGSTPGALRLYGIPDSAYKDDSEMFALMHEMRVRVMTAPAFTGDRVIATILFERTMDGMAGGKSVPAFLWEERGIVPFLKVDKGLEDEREGVNLMKPIQGLGALLDRAAGLGVYGTKMRSAVRLPLRSGISAIVDQQFDLAMQIADYGLMPILEPEVLIKSPDKEAAEAILLAELVRRLDALPSGRRVMLKLTIPNIANLYEPLSEHQGVVRVVALSGGYSRDEACERLSRNRDMIASFSRALLEGLTHDMSDTAFDAQLKHSIDEIYTASTMKNN